MRRQGKKGLTPTLYRDGLKLVRHAIRHNEQSLEYPTIFSAIQRTSPEIPHLQWTGTKRELLELIIALHDTAIIHDPTTHKPSDFSDLLKAIEVLFPDTQLKYSYAERREMRQRYTNTPFLDKLRLAFGKNSKI